jgi:thymidylate synthase
MLSGSTNIEYLNSNGVHIWDPWADKNGDLGPVYGKQWTSWGPDGVNKVFNVQELIKNDPYSRRIIINAWNVGELDKMALPPCHILFQFYPEPTTRRLSLIVYMRSADIFLGLPFDVAEGALLLQMMSAVTGYYPDMLTYMVGDLHLYVNHVEQAKKQLKRNYRPVPNLTIPVRDSVFEYQYEDFVLAGYEPHDAIKVEVAV